MISTATDHAGGTRRNFSVHERERLEKQVFGDRVRGHGEAPARQERGGVLGAETNGEHGGKADRIIGRQKAQQPVRPEAEPVAPVDFVERRRHHEARQDEKRPDSVEAHMRGVFRTRKMRKHDDEREDEAKRSGQGIALEPTAEGKTSRC